MIGNTNILVFLLSICHCISFVLSVSSTGSRVLVVLEQRLEKAHFSRFFDGLEDRGYNLTFRVPKDARPQLITDDVPNFDHLVLFAPTTKSFAQDITPQSLITLMSHGVNVLITLSPTQTPFHSLATEFGLIVPPPGTPLISHFSSPRDVLSIPLSPNPLLSSGTKGSILFKGISYAYTPHPALFPILKAPAESFASDADVTNDKGHDAIVDSAERGGEGLWAGSSMGVVSGFVAKNGARACFVGGVDLFGDDFAGQTAGGEKVANAPFVQDLAGWTFQESLVLRITDVLHHLDSANSTNPPVKDTYTINDRIRYTIHIEQYVPSTQIWAPFIPPTDAGDRLQLEYTMLDPHIRTNLSAVSSKPGFYTTTFRAPDRHGVFKLSFSYLRAGYTPLHSSIVTPLVPPRHDGYPRFLSAAWPYYAGAVSTSVGFVLFCALWLGGVSEGVGGKGKKKME